MEFKSEIREKSIRSYVIRAGRMTRAQKQAFDDSWPHYGLKLGDGELDPRQTFGKPAPLVVEIGFGMGDSLIKMAENCPDSLFVGIEVYPPGVGRLMKRAHEMSLKNLRVYMADANDVMEECIGKKMVDSVINNRLMVAVKKAELTLN